MSKNNITRELPDGGQNQGTTAEKSAKIFTAAAGFTKGNVEAYAQSGAITAEGFRTISTEIALYSRKSIEETISATREIMNSKSTHEAVELQTSFASMAFSAYLGQLRLLNGLFVDTMKEAMAPVQRRFEALSERAKGAPAP